MYRTLSNYIPGYIAKYSDEFEPRAFGDNFQKWGTSTILIESGGWKDDPEKQQIRKMNFIGILSALKSIADESYKEEPNSTYDSIPFNDKFIMDLLLKNLAYKCGDTTQIIDIGINRDEVNKAGAKDFYYKSKIEDVGDLSVFYGYDELDLTGYEAVPGKIYDKEFSSISELEKADFNSLYSDGFTFVRINPSAVKDKFIDLPINIVTDKNYTANSRIVIEDNPDFVIKKDGIVKYAVINGFLYNLEKPENKKGNGLKFPL
jgi:hypothetical protein